MKFLQKLTKKEMILFLTILLFLNFTFNALYFLSVQRGKNIGGSATETFEDYSISPFPSFVSESRFFYQSQTVYLKIKSLFVDDSSISESSYLITDILGNHVNGTLSKISPYTYAASFPLSLLPSNQTKWYIKMRIADSKGIAYEAVSSINVMPESAKCEYVSCENFWQEEECIKNECGLPCLWKNNTCSTNLCRAYDSDCDGTISNQEFLNAEDDWLNGIISLKEYKEILAMRNVRER